MIQDEDTSSQEDLESLESHEDGILDTTLMDTEFGLDTNETGVDYTSVTTFVDDVIITEDIYERDEYSDSDEPDNDFQETEFINEKYVDDERDEYTGFNAQADPEFLYCEDEFISEDTKDIYSDLETVSIEEKQYKPLIVKKMEPKVIKKTQFKGIKNGKRTIEVKNPEYSSWKRKHNALTNSLKIWGGRQVLATEALAMLKVKREEVIAKGIPTADIDHEIKTGTKAKENIERKIIQIKKSLEGLGTEPLALIEEVTDIVVPARELREYYESHGNEQ